MKNDFWKERRVFVTGGTGFLGSHLCEQLVNLGANVIILERDFIPESYLYKSKTFERINRVSGEVEDFQTVSRVLAEYEIQDMFHLAAQSQVVTAIRWPLSTFESNIKGTWTILEAARQYEKCESVIVASSDKAYGENKGVALVESDPLVGSAPYEVSKSCTDLITQSYFKTFDLPVVAIARCGNLYGAGDLNFQRLIPYVIKCILEDKSPVLRSDGKSKRDYLYIDDGVKAYITLAEKIQKSKGEAFNFGTETPHSVFEVVNMIRQIMGDTKHEPILGEQSSHEIPIQYLDSKKASEKLGWSPDYDLKSGLINTIEWYKQNILN